MHSIRRASVAAALLVCAACVLLLRRAALLDPPPFPGFDARLAGSLGRFAIRMQFPGPWVLALVALLAVSLGALAAAWRSAGLPSPARDVRLEGPEHAFLARGVTSLACLAAFVAAEAVLVAVLFRESIPPAWLWAAGLVALAGAAAFADRAAARRPSNAPAVGTAELVGVLAVSVLCAALAGNGLNGWEWTGSPDSYGFYGVARELWSGARRAAFLSPDGVFGLYPVATSWMQMLLFPILGPTGEALRAGNLLLVAALAALGHVFARPLVGRTGAFATAALLGSSVLVQTYAKNGYNNLQGLFFAMLALALASRAAATRRWTWLVLSGMAAGLGLFSYALAAISGGAILLWIALSGGPARRSVRAAAVFVLASLAAGAPCLLSRHYLEAHRQKVSVFSPELNASDPETTSPSSRLLQGLVQPVYNRDVGHATGGPRLDPVSAVLVLAGLATLAGGIGARGASRALLATVLFWPAAIALLQPYPYPSSTWFLLATPAWAILGGCGVAALGAALSAGRRSALLALVALPAAAAWGAWQVHESALSVAPLSPLAYTVAAARAAGGSGVPTVLVVVLPPRSGAEAPIVEAVLDADVPAVTLEMRSDDDADLPSRLVALAGQPALLALYEVGEPHSSRDQLRESVRSAWPGAHEALYRALASPPGEPTLRVFVNARANAAAARLPTRNLSKK